MRYFWWGDNIEKKKDSYNWLGKDLPNKMQWGFWNQENRNIQ